MGKRKQAAGNYRHKMLLEEPTQGGPSGSGETTDTWSEYATMWCSLRPIRGDEFLAAAQVQSETTHVIRTWYRSDITIRTNMRLNLRDTRYFYIESFISVNEENKEFEFRVKEQS